MKEIVLETALSAGYTVSQVLSQAESVRTRIYGGYFSEAGLKAQVGIPKGTWLVLRSDKDNKHDSFAIKVCKQEKKKLVELGFLKTELASAIESLDKVSCVVYKEIELEDIVGSAKVVGLEIRLIFNL